MSPRWSKRQTRSSTEVREATIVKHIQDFALAQPDVWIVKLHGEPSQVSGLPDLLLCYRGRFVGLEVKLPGEHPTAIQAWTLQEIRLAGGVAECVHSLEEAVAVLNRIGG